MQKSPPLKNPRSLRLSFSRWGIAAGVLIAAFLALTCYRLDSPGLIWDRLLDEFQASAWAAEFRQGRVPSNFFDGYPLYHGFLTSYMMVPVFWLFGPSYTVVKFWPVVFGALTLLVVFFLVARSFSPKTALLALFLLVIHPSFTGGIRVGNFQVSYMIFLTSSALWCLSIWWEKGTEWTWPACFFLLGLGMGTRLWFGFFVGALALTLSLFWRDVKRRFGRNWARLITMAVLAFCGGLLPILAREFSGNFPSFEAIVKPYHEPLDPPRLHLVLWFLWTSLSGILSGRWIVSIQFENLPVHAENPFYIWCFLACLAWSIPAIYGKRVPSPKAWPFFWALFAFILAFFLISPSAKLSPGKAYFFVIYPLPQILVAAAFVHAIESLRKSRWRLVPVLSLCLLTLSEIRALAGYMNAVHRFGGAGNYSEAAKDLSGWLSARSKEADVVAVGYPFLLANLYFWDPRLSYMALDYGPDLWEVPGTHHHILLWQKEIRALDYRKIPKSMVPLGLLDNPEENFFPGWEDEIKRRNIDSLHLVRFNKSELHESGVDLVIYWAVRRSRSLELKARFFEADGTCRFEVYLLRPNRPADTSGHRRFDPDKMSF